MSADQLTFPGMTPPDPYHRARRTDPETSHEAARQVEASGSATAHADLIAQAVREWPGRTTAELAENMRIVWKVGWSNVRHEVARRMCEVVRSGHARAGEPRTCKATGRRAQTWEPA